MRISTLPCHSRKAETGKTGDVGGHECRKGGIREVDKSHSAGRDCRHRFHRTSQARDISNMGSRRNPVFQRNIQVYVWRRMPAANCRNSHLHPDSAGLLRLRRGHAPSIINTVTINKELSCEGRLFQYKHIGQTAGADILNPLNYRAKLADAHWRTARSGRKAVPIYK